jgi:hypothetical protein
MRRLPSRRPTTLLLAAASAVGVIGVNAGPAQAYTLDCRASSTACLSFSGFTGQSTWGFPVNSTGNNCVNYAAYRLARNGVAKPGNLGNGGDWGNRAAAMGYRVDRTPVAGSIAWWSYGSYFAPSNGHVGYVEEVNGSTITISDSSWSGGSKRYRLTAGEANWPNRFIHFKDVGYTPPRTGSFVRARENGVVYKMVGRTPVQVTSWAPYGGTKPTMPVYRTSLLTLPTKIANGSFIKGTARGEVFRVVGGAPIYVSSWASVGGSKATTLIAQNTIDLAGSSSSYAALSRYPATSYASAVDSTGRVINYKVSAGWAYRLRSWSQVGGVKPTVRIDMAAITHAGQAGKWSHLKGTSLL